jgi:hypothetical protein
MNQIQRYPLQWPIGHKRTLSPLRSKFKATLGRAIQNVIEEVSRLKYGCVTDDADEDVVISSNVPLRLDGLPRATYSQVKDCGVAVYFNYQKKPVVLCCDKWDKVEDNMHALAKTIEYTRAQERWGVSDFIEKAFTGFQALPAPKAWWDVIGCQPHASWEEIQKAYRQKVKEVHPDACGSTEDFQNLQVAMAAAQQRCGIK